MKISQRLAIENRLSRHSRGGDYDAALQDLNKTANQATLWQQAAVAYYYRGFAYMRQKEYAKAVADLTRSIQLDPSYYWSYKQRAKAYRNLGKFKLAQADEQKAAEETFITR